MDSTSSNLVMALFDEAAFLDPPARAQFLDQRCGDDAIRREVESLLSAYEDADGFLNERSLAAGRGQDVAFHRPGSKIGNYELLDLLGEGGFAHVFRARQTKPVRRDVAIKIIKLGMDTRAVIGRFELERQALAMMDHPGIAAVYDAGATDLGRPFFVMELVRGERITRFAEDNELETQGRVKLFIDVCHAVHHAHQKGILHRDLKPSNILVTTVDDRPQPKIIDFGIAKATQGRVTDATIMTGEHQLLGTPRYMSPEQAISGGADVDTRSDIFSLGAVLYELLAGVAPMQSANDAPSSVITHLHRLRSEHATPLPSTRVNDAARRRELRGELDWIVLKCLSFDRAHRYESAAALAADLQAYLEHRPIVAAPPAATYRIKKFVRRNTLAVSAAAIVLAVMIVGTIVSLTQALRAKRAERLAQARLDDSEAANDGLKAVNEFLTQYMLRSADQSNVPGRESVARQALEDASRLLPRRFADRPLIEALVRDHIAMAYVNLGRADLALPQAQRVLEIRTELLGEDHPDAIAAENHQVSALVAAGRFQIAEPVAMRALERSRDVLGERHPQTMDSLLNYSRILMSLGRWAECEPFAKQAWESSTELLGENRYKTIGAMTGYARVIDELGRADEAGRLYKDALDRRQRTLSEDHPELLTSMFNYAIWLANNGRNHEAEELYKATLAGRRRVMGDDHRNTILTLNRYALLLQKMGRLEEALALHTETLERRRRVLGENHLQTVASRNHCAEVLRRLGRGVAAEPLATEASETVRLREQGSRGGRTADAANRLGEMPTTAPSAGPDAWIGD